jgi:hypothetical protein
MTRALLCIVVCCGLIVAVAALAKTVPTSDTITITNLRTTEGLHDTSLQVASLTRGGTVYLNSPGGSARVASAIGNHVHGMDITTIIADGAECLSACVLIWHASPTRQIEGSGRLGYHRWRTDETKTTDTTARASIVAYLYAIQAPVEQVMSLMESTPPDEVRYVNRGDAILLGLLDPDSF